MQHLAILGYLYQLLGKHPDEVQVLPSRVTAGCQRHQKSFLHRICFFKTRVWVEHVCMVSASQKNKRTHRNPGFLFKNQTTKTAQRRRRHRLKKKHKALTSLVDFWTLPLDSRNVQKGRNCSESPESDWKNQGNKPFGVRFFRVYGLTAQVNHGHDAGGLGWADPLEGRSAEDAGDGDNGWDGGKWWGFIYNSKYGMPPKNRWDPMFFWAIFFSFPTLGLVRLWGSFEDHNLWK